MLVNEALYKHVDDISKQYGGQERQFKNTFLSQWGQITKLLFFSNSNRRGDIIDLPPGGSRFLLCVVLN